ncbi:peroxisomal (S)-2-hydroxy-acid oxidase [Paracoccidioides lutzii Pb01]|uniref:Peroxisomal (S)-2-hydroxy-acid oxidase n=1 Tax=Paracoccidioides lutzii (strain ATCC MYA-826 / Pb01) TaxID=502779 RepID=C1H9Z6_PARBA|nr:peroxisomal (S)-2-hydroxy-acid oxidase [Paracoccidioides lutzii Pb01]EEH37169.1 peroxisomal (S)-2-hydroxy-acid oxidase [Paracoccidioides lutzii Pb01]
MRHNTKRCDAQDDGLQKEDPITIAELATLAQKKLPKQVWDYYASGADEENALRRNRGAFDRLILRPRVLRDVSRVDTSTTLLGKKYSIPIGISPSAMQRLAGGNGEIDMARAAASRGTTMILSSHTTCALEDVIRAPDGGSSVDFWFQLYISQNRERCAQVIGRAEAAGYKALVLTVDTPILGNRINERKTALILPPHLSLANLHQTINQSSPEGNSPQAKPTMNRILLEARNAQEAAKIARGNHDTLNDSSLTWSNTISWLRSKSSLKIILKGIMTAEDALLAIDYGADAVIVSNHGGRQLDSVSSTIEALPEIVSAVRGRIPVIIDSGITRGSDVFKALALGADFTLVGRSALWGLSFGGQEGVIRVLDILERELSRTMALAGAGTVGEIRRSMLGVEKKDGFGISRL